MPDEGGGVSSVRRREGPTDAWENLGTSYIDHGRFAFGGWRSRRSLVEAVRRWWWQHRIVVSTTLTVLLTLLLGGIEALESFSRIELPSFLRHPLVPILLTMLILWSSLSSYTQSRRSLVFHRRFVRPGLGELLRSEGETLSRGAKLFRGHDAVVMKIDVESYTFLTFDMPYGMRRLFLDLWFTLVDDVVANDAFFDKSLGDGSFYLFDAGRRGGGCRFALAAARRVRDETVPAFDSIFRERLLERLDESPQLRIASELYFERYRQRAGSDFWHRHTAVRIALVAGCVDEGLWGLSDQSHYDVQGTPLVLATRLEQAAASGEILLDSSFVEQLRRELGERDVPPGLEMRTVELRGIGESRVWALPAAASRRPASRRADVGPRADGAEEAGSEREEGVDSPARGALGL